MKQNGLVLVLSLLVLVSITILGVSAVSSSLMQSKMATTTQQQGLTFDAAEAAIAGVIYEAEDEQLLADAQLDVLTEARQLNPFNPAADVIACNGNTPWIERNVTANGLKKITRHTVQGDYDAIPGARSWSRTAFVREEACRGSSTVVGGSNINCHLFLIRGCGSIQSKSTVVANSLTASVVAPASL